MKRWNYLACLAAGILTLSMSMGQAKAASVTYVMGDHPNGDLISKGAYGLRLDEWYKSLFSVGVNIDILGGGPVTLTFDPDDLSKNAVLEGKIKLTASTNGGSPAYDVWTLKYEMWNLTAAPNGGFNALAGKGSISDDTPGDIDSGFDLVEFIGKSDGNSVFTFDNDGHRLGSNTGWVARGWVEGFKYVDEKTCKWVNGKKKCETKKVLKTVSWDGANDFLMTGRPGGDLTDVPEPSTLLLTMGGAALLWFRKRRQS